MYSEFLNNSNWIFSGSQQTLGGSSSYTFALWLNTLLFYLFLEMHFACDMVTFFQSHPAGIDGMGMSECTLLRFKVIVSLFKTISCRCILYYSRVVYWKIVNLIKTKWKTAYWITILWMEWMAKHSIITTFSFTRDVFLQLNWNWNDFKFLTNRKPNDVC